MNVNPWECVLGVILIVMSALGLSFCFGGERDSLGMDEIEGSVQLNIQRPGWEGVIWKDPVGGVLGIAVREMAAKGDRRKSYRYGDSTLWGGCGKWSKVSPGKYCLIPYDKMTTSGLFVLGKTVDPDKMNAIP